MAQGGDLVVHAVEPGVLREVPEPAGAVHDAGERIRVAAQDLKEARLAGTVAADEAHLVAGADREADPVHDDGAAHLHSELADLQHPTMVTGPG